MTNNNNIMIKNGRFNVDVKNLSTEQMEFLNSISQQHDTKTKGDLFHVILSIARKKYERTTGATDNVLERISNIVKTQMDINQNTTESITVGTGKNKKTVKFQQRVITAKWIVENVKPTPRLESVHQWLDEHSAEVLEHNQWLIESSGHKPSKLGESASLDQCIETFNRSAGINHKNANKDEWEHWSETLNGNGNES